MKPRNARPGRGPAVAFLLWALCVVAAATPAPLCLHTAAGPAVYCLVTTMPTPPPAALGYRGAVGIVHATQASFGEAASTAAHAHMLHAAVATDVGASAFITPTAEHSAVVVRCGALGGNTTLGADAVLLPFQVPTHGAGPAPISGRPFITALPTTAWLLAAHGHPANQTALVSFDEVSLCAAPATTDSSWSCDGRCRNGLLCLATVVTALIVVGTVVALRRLFVRARTAAERVAEGRRRGAARKAREAGDASFGTQQLPSFRMKRGPEQVRVLRAIVAPDGSEAPDSLTNFPLETTLHATGRSQPVLTEPGPESPDKRSEARGDARELLGTHSHFDGRQSLMSDGTRLLSMFSDQSRMLSTATDMSTFTATSANPAGANPTVSASGAPKTPSRGQGNSNDTSLRPGFGARPGLGGRFAPFGRPHHVTAGNPLARSRNPLTPLLGTQSTGNPLQPLSPAPSTSPDHKADLARRSTPHTPALQHNQAPATWEDRHGDAPPPPPAAPAAQESHVFLPFSLDADHDAIEVRTQSMGLPPQVFVQPPLHRTPPPPLDQAFDSHA